MKARVDRVIWEDDYHATCSVELSMGGATIIAFAPASSFEDWAQAEGKMIDVILGGIPGSAGSPNEWTRVISGNESREKGLERTGRWSYDARCQVTGVSPTVGDFGSFSMEIDDFICVPDDAKDVVGRFIRFQIERLDVGMAGQ